MDPRDTAGWSQLEAETEPASQLAEPPRRSIAALTILCHPDGKRVGEAAPLPALAAGASVTLSRLEPLFGKLPAAGRRPLGVRRLSRRPIVLAPGPRGGLDVVASGSPTPLVLDNQPLRGRHRLSSDDLHRGAVLLLGNRVVLLLHRLRQDPDRGTLPSFGMVGESDSILRMRREIRRLANSDLPVLLRGETGTGKELVARALHGSSPRRQGPLVTVNMGAIPPSLAAAELFGAQRGAFTGADRPRVGFFRRAHGGTLFLDEIGAAPPEIQPLLLRALEDGEIQSVGSETPTRTDARIIAATDADLEEEVEAGRFRAPLLHRLGGYEIPLPPLRQRREDIGRLLYHFLRQELHKTDREDLLDDTARPRPWLPAVLVSRLAAFDWPGNVRQLRHVARGLAVRGAAESEARPDAALDALLGDGPSRPTSSSGFRSPGEVDEDELVRALAANRWRPAAAARQLGISRPSLYLLIDASSKVRKAADLSRREIQQAMEDTAGDLDAMVEKLQVSAEALRRRMRELDL